jgi:uncharacterized protein (TIGR02246 family)
MRSKLFLILTVAALVAAGASPAAQKRSAAPSSTETQLKALVERYFTAWSTRNPERAAPLYAKEADAVFIFVTDPVYRGWDDYRAGRGDYLSQFSTVQLTPGSDLKVTRKGTTVAITTVSFNGTGTLKESGAEVTFAGRHTAVWEKRGTEWVIITEHLSQPAPTIVTAPPPAFSSDAEQIPIRAMVEQYETNWNQGNGKALAGLFQPDADIGIMASGSVTAGRPKVEEMWAQSFGRRPQNFSTRVDGSIASIRFLRPDIAIVDGTFDYWPDAASEKRSPPAAQERFSMTMVKGDGQWQIAAARVVPVPKEEPQPKKKR